MNTHHNPNSDPPPTDQQQSPSEAELFESTKLMIGGLAPYLSFGVALQAALVKASLAGVSLDYEGSVRAAIHHISSGDPAVDAVAVVHAGMAFVGALRAGVSPADAGICVTEALFRPRGIEGASGATNVDY